MAIPTLQNDDDGSDPDPNEDQAAETAPPDRPALRPDEYKRQHLGREAMDRWMLHKTFLNDEAEDAPPSGDREAS